MKQMKIIKLTQRMGLNPLPGLTVLVATLLNACTTTTIDEFRQGATGIDSTESVVVLGRRQGAAYQTSVDFVECVGERMSRGENAVSVVPEQQFVDAMFPWFEPRTAPLRSDDLQGLMEQPLVTDKMEEFGIRYIIWLDGETVRTEGMGQMSCTISPAGGGCFGFGSWEDESNFEAHVWDVSSRITVGAISADASGQSYVPAVFVPIPLIARVEANACNSLANQLKGFVQGE